MLVLAAVCDCGIPWTFLFNCFDFVTDIHCEHVWHKNNKVQTIKSVSHATRKPVFYGLPPDKT